MKKLIMIFLLFVPSLAFSQVRVKGYTRKNGTYVQPHVRSNPDGYKYNNYSSYGNTNPYTGKSGTKNKPSSSSYNYGTFNSGSYTPSSTYVPSASYSYPKSSHSSKSYTKDESIENEDYALSMVYFCKEGPEFYESFSIKNNTSTDVNRIKIRIMYYVDSECVDYRDLSLSGTIPSGLTKKFEVRSFDQQQKFVYHTSTSYTSDLYTRFSVRMKVLQYFKCY